MNVDERIEALTARHEALAQSVELLVLGQREMQARQEVSQARQLEMQARQEVSQERQLEMQERQLEMQAKNEVLIAGILESIGLDAENIRGLARISKSHEARLTHLEG